MSVVTSQRLDYVEVGKQFTLPVLALGDKVPTAGSLQYNTADDNVYVSDGRIWLGITGSTTIQDLQVNNLTTLGTLTLPSLLTDLEINNLTVLQSLHINGGGADNTLVDIHTAQTANRTQLLSPYSGVVTLDTNQGVFTNKTVTDVTDNVVASSINTLGGPVVVSASSAPSSGYALVATSSNTAQWEAFTLDNVAGVLPVSKGGTGSANFTSGRVLVGRGTNSVIATKVAPIGTFVGTTDAQTLTNKTITDSTNTVYASGLNTTGAAVVVSGAAPPTSGQVLTASSATAASWTTPSPSTTVGALKDATGIVNVSNSSAPTSGQVLAAVSPTMAQWVNPSASTVATALQDATGNVSVSAAIAPTAGQVLTATSGTIAAWQTPTPVGTASNLIDATGVVNVSASPAPSAGQVLKAINSTQALWSSPTSDTVLSMEVASSLTVDAGATSVFNNTTDSVNYATGAIVCAGGIGAAKTVWAGTKLATGGPSALLAAAGGSASTITTVVGTQISSRLITLPDATGTIDLSNTTATLTHKTITDSSNNVSATSLKTNVSGSPVVVGTSAPPVSGARLTAINSISAHWVDSTFTFGWYIPNYDSSISIDRVSPHFYYRAGNRVNVYGKIHTDYTDAITQAYVRVSLPIAPSSTSNAAYGTGAMVTTGDVDTISTYTIYSLYAGSLVTSFGTIIRIQFNISDLVPPFNNGHELFYNFSYAIN